MPVPTSELQSVSPTSVIELFELQLVTALHGSADVYRYHSGSSLNLSGVVTWNSNTYTRYPVEADGFEYSGTGQLPQPKLRVSNIAGTITALLLIVNGVTPGNDLIGAKVTRIRTLARYLDAANFPARRNLLLRTDEFDQAAWTKVRSVATASGTIGPFGEPTAKLFREDSTASSTHYVEQTVSGLLSSTAYSFSVYAKPAGRDIVRLELVAGTAYSSTQAGTFDIASDRLLSTTGTPTAAVSDAGNGYAKCSLTATTTGAGSVTVRIYLQAAAGSTTYSGDGASGVTLAAAQLEAGSGSDYQAIGASFSQNPFGTPDPTVEFPREIYYISQKVNENRDYVEFALSAAFDLQGVRAPRRQCIANICQWVYRSTECGYLGTAYFNESDVSVGSAALDVCGKRTSSCRIRFAANSNLSTAGTSSTLNAGSTLASGSQLVSTNGWYRLAMQTDGNLVLYDKSGLVRWSTSTNLAGASRLVMQADGNLVVLRNSDNAVMWASGTVGSGGNRLVLQTDGNAVIYTAANVAVWATDTGNNGEPGNPAVALPYGSFPGVGSYFS